MMKSKNDDTDSTRLFGKFTCFSLKTAKRFLFWFSVALLVYACFLAFFARFLSVSKYGYLIHEFDPWFQFRATRYLSTHGWNAFFHWFDDKSWYPIGRPVGTTIYPGLPMTAAGIHWLLQQWRRISLPLSHVCVLMPAWFGVVATVLAGLLAYELSFCVSSFSITALIFSILPAHLMRSMAGEFDNECIAVAAMLLTFYAWVRSLRTPTSWPLGALAGIAYGYMVSAWGGYVFVLNLIALHAGFIAMTDWLLFPNTYSSSLCWAYILFYSVGTSIAVCVPPVGWAPFQSLEQLPAFVILLLLLSLQGSECIRSRLVFSSHSSGANDNNKKTHLKKENEMAPVRSLAVLKIRVSVLAGTLTVLVALTAVLAPTGYFGPVSSRVRALFVRHTLTGNPLVDSVAEHRPTADEAYIGLLNWSAFGWPLGTLWLTVDCLVLPLWRQVFGTTPRHGRPQHDQHAPYEEEEDRDLLPFHRQSKVFIWLYAIVAFYFSRRMSRLMLLAGPVAGVTTGHVMGQLLDAGIHALFWEYSPDSVSTNPKGSSDVTTHPQTEEGKEKKTKEKTGPQLTRQEGKTNGRASITSSDPGSVNRNDVDDERRVHQRKTDVDRHTNCISGKASRSSSTTRHPILWLVVSGTGALLVFFLLFGSGFLENNMGVADQFGQPLLVFEAMIDPTATAAGTSATSTGAGDIRSQTDTRADNKQRVIVSDYLDAYLWLRNHTPKDARVLAWWDYGYHISGISERTTLADGNTWNHEHIATIGKLLTAPIRESHALVRHMADYVLIWAGPDATDLHKSAHMARIANSVYHDVCPDDPLCETFGFVNHRLDMPTPSMQRSLLYHLHFDGFMVGARVPPHLFREVYTSKYDLVRIYKVMDVSRESKEWVASHRSCSTKPNEEWICPGQYPPAPEIDALLAKRHDFSQLEDFNRGGRNDTYYRAYMEKLKKKVESSL